jgi:hypothetical protein
MSPTPTPGIERCEAAVVAALQAIQIANGYRTDVRKVYRVPLNADQLPDGANLVVVPVPDGLTLEARNEQLYRVTDRLIVGGVVKIGTGDLNDPERAIRANLLLEDTIDALNADPSFGFNQQVDSVFEVADRGSDADRGFGLFSLRLHLTYNFARETMR